MKVIEINEEYIKFDNGNLITFNHYQDCCEYNYADFEQLRDTSILDEDFSEDLIFEKAEYGFRFGNENNMFFVPCYSMQSGFYSFDVDIYYNGEEVLNVECC